MTSPPPRDVTTLLLAWREGNEGALEALVPLVYAELRRLAHIKMRGERANHPLQTTALVHEAYLRLIDTGRVHWKNRVHFFAVASQAMRRVLVDLARTRDAQKRGGDFAQLPFDEARDVAPARRTDFVALDDALTALAEFDARKARVVELRYFGGLTLEETAEVLEMSSDTVMRDWKMARLWLLKELEAGSSDPASRRQS